MLLLKQKFLRSSDSVTLDVNMIFPLDMSAAHLTGTLHPADPRGASPLFSQSKRDALDGLVKRGAFELVPELSVHP